MWLKLKSFSEFFKGRWESLDILERWVIVVSYSLWLTLTSTFLRLRRGNVFLFNSTFSSIDFGGEFETHDMPRHHHRLSLLLRSTLFEEWQDCVPRMCHKLIQSGKCDTLWGWENALLCKEEDFVIVLFGKLDCHQNYIFRTVFACDIKEALSSLLRIPWTTRDDVGVTI